MKLRIKNFRSFKDTGDVEIKPITLLIGKNSSGKSSFLRTFPLLKQSAEIEAKTPISLYGKYVDFGSLKNVTPKFSKNSIYEQEIIISQSEREKIFSTDLNSILLNGDIKITLKYVNHKNEYLKTSNIKINSLKNKAEIFFNHKEKLIDKIIINDSELINIKDNISFNYSNQLLGFKLFRDEKNTMNLKDFSSKSILDSISATLVFKILLKYLDNEEDSSSVFLEIIQYGSSDLLRKMKDINVLDWQKKIKNWTENTNDFIELKNLIILSQLTVQLVLINTYLNTLFKNLKYIGPTRISQRDYRILNLSTDEVDKDGANLPDFIESLDDEQKIDFQKWTKDNFGFKIDVKRNNGYQSIMISHNGEYLNITDVGFGYSQILPILTQIWFTLTQNSKDNNGGIIKSDKIPKIITLEQPELHLHPEFQAKFTDAIVNVVKDAQSKGIDIRLIIETHSNIIVSRLGQAIILDEISKDDINIVIFDKENYLSETKVSFAQFDEDGDLTGWPIGFFYPPIKG